MKIRIGTRKSKLALAQTDIFIKRLKADFPGIETEIVHITTKGDKILNESLSKIGGKGVFVSEIEKALQTGEIDIAVHSAKDLPMSLDEGLEISGVLERGNYRDVLVTKTKHSFTNASSAGKNISGEFVVGTGSPRRRANLKRIYPNVIFRDIRGNVDTRLNKLRNGEYDGIILAAAGLERLGLHNDPEFEFQTFDYTEFLPATCQGIIAIESRKNDPVAPLIQKITHIDTLHCFETERKVLELLGADCTMPVGAFAEIFENKIRLTISKDGEKILSGDDEVPQRFILAERLVMQL